MNKLEALRMLSRAYWHIVGRGAENDADTETLDILNNSFGYVRRSIRVEDMRPESEGLNGRMPQYF